MKKILAIALSVVMSVSLIACAAPAASAPDTAAPVAEAAEPTEEVKSNAPAQEGLPKIGLICWGYSDDESRSYVKYLDAAAAACNFQMEYAIYASDEDIINQAENLCEAGCTGIIVDNVSQPLMDLCESKGVYLALWASEIVDDALREYCENCQFYAGCTPQDNRGTFAHFTEELYKKGCRNLMVCGNIGGALMDERMVGIDEVVASHDDLKIVADWREVGGDSKIADASDNMLKMYPEIDGIVSNASINGFADSIIQSKVNNGKADIPYSTLYWENAEQALADGTLYETTYSTFSALAFLAVAMSNYAKGWKLDEPFKVLQMNHYVTSAEDLKEVNGYINVLAGAPVPVSDEEFKSLSYDINPDVTVDDFSAILDKETIEGFRAKYAK